MNSFKLALLSFLLVFLIICIIKNNNKFSETFTEQSIVKNNRFKLVVTTYNPGKYLEECLKSIEEQKYKNYQVCVVDDASTKDKKYLEHTILKYCNRNRWKYIIQKVNLGPLESRINAINKLECEDDDIILLIDGDDMLSNNDVLNLLNKYYQEDIYVSFGSFSNRYEGKVGKRGCCNCSKNFKRIIAKGQVREKWLYSHLKTMKYYIYKHINHEKSLKHDGKYFRSATDIALMCPAIELAGADRIKCIPEVLYYYTLDHPESFHNNGRRQNQIDNHNIIKKQEKYRCLFDSKQNNSKSIETFENNTFKFVVFIITCDKYKDRRDMIEKTWFQDFKKKGVPIFFVYGDDQMKSESRIDGNNLYLKFKECYENLPIKSKLIVDYYNKNYSQKGYQGMFKIDDDNFVNVCNIFNYEYLFKYNNYVGKRLGGTDQSPLKLTYVSDKLNKEMKVKNLIQYKPFGEYSSGILYWLSNKSTRVINEFFKNNNIHEEQYKSHYCEDFMIGKILNLNQISLIDINIDENPRIVDKNANYFKDINLKDYNVCLITNLNSNEINYYYQLYNIKNNFDFYYINLDKDSERKNKLLEITDNIPIQFNRFPGIYGKELPDSELQIYKDNNYVNDNFLSKKTKGALGAGLSHIRLIERCSQDAKSYIIFEDDIELDKHFYNNLNKFLKNLPSDWDIFYLYLNDFYLNKKQRKNKKQRYEVNNIIYKPISPIGLVAYGVNHKSCKKIIKYLKPLNNDAIDDRLAYLIDEGYVKAYTTRNNIVLHPTEYYSNTFETKKIRNRIN